MKARSYFTKLIAAALAAAALIVPVSLTSSAAQTQIVGVKTSNSATVPLGGDNITLELNKQYTFPEFTSGLTGNIYKVRISDKAVLSYKNGIFTATGEGETNVAVTTTGGSVIKFHVRVKTPTVSVRLSVSDLDLTVGQKKALNAITSASKSTLKWTSSDTKVVSVDKNGNITAKKKGTATVTVKTANGKSSSCTVKVNEVRVTGVRLDISGMTLGIGQKRTINSTVYPVSATDKTIKWSSSDNRIATVDKNGVVLAKKDGVVKITAESTNGKKSSCSVTVKAAPKTIRFTKDSVTVTVGKPGYVTLEGQAGSLTGGVTYKSSDNSVCSVSASGKLTAKKPGKVTVTAKAYNGKTAKCTVNVK